MCPRDWGERAWPRCPGDEDDLGPLAGYRKPPTISPGLIYFRKRFLMGLYKGGLIYGGAYTWTIFCVSVIVINKYSNSDKQVLIIVIIVINSDKQVGLYSGGLIFGGGLYLE